MKLKEFNSENCINARAYKNQPPRIGINIKVGLFRFNPEACSLLGLKDGDKITFHMDEEDPSSWYIEKVKEKGFELRFKENVGKGVLFNNSVLARQIAASVEFTGTSGHLLLAGKPELFIPHCNKVNIAGSIRREKKEVKDIEIICLPKKEFVKTDLFGGGQWCVVKEFLKIIAEIQQSIVKGNAHGRYMQIILKGGITLDLFMPQPHDYYRQYATRTGSAEYSALVIAYTWKKNGWCGTHDGLRKITDCTLSKSGNWLCIATAPEIPPAWKSEEEFFSWLGLEWCHPKERETKTLINQFS